MCAVPEVTQPQLSACATPQPAPMRFPSLLIHNDQQMGSSIGAPLGHWVLAGTALLNPVPTPDRMAVRRGCSPRPEAWVTSHYRGR